MPKPPQSLPSGVRVTDMLSITQFAAVFPMKDVIATLEKHGCGTIRERLLLNEAVVYFVMLLALFRDCSHREVYRCVAEALCRVLGKKTTNIEIPTSSALSQARARLGSEPFKELFHEFAIPLGTPGQEEYFFKRWRKCVIDGSVMNVDDTESNRDHFGSPTNQHDTGSRNPQLRFVGLMESGSRLIFAAEQGGYHDGEITLARKLVSRMTSEMIILGDRNFYSYSLFKEITNQGAALLFRVQRGICFKQQEQLPDGSYIIEIADSKKEGLPIKARLIQYKVTGAASKETFFLITNILDHTQASAQELAVLYHERWEYETGLDELKTHLGVGSVVLRSKRPELVKQEMWGNLMTYYVVRKNMHEAALQADRDPDRLSFTHTVHVIRRAIIKSNADFSP